MPLPKSDAGGAAGAQGTGGAGGGRNDAEFADKVRAAADRRTKAAILAASAPECSFLLCSPQRKGRARHVAPTSPLTVARSVHTAAAATAASSDRESTARELPLADSHLAGGSPELGIHTPGRSGVILPSEYLPQDRSGRSLLRLHGRGGRAGEPVWDIIGQGDADWGESGGISEAVINWRMQATGARSQQTERELEMLSSPPRGAWCGAGAARRGGGLMGSPNNQRGADRSTRGQRASGAGPKRRNSLSPSQRSRARVSRTPRKVEMVEGVVHGIEYKEGLTLSPTELWQVGGVPRGALLRAVARKGMHSRSASVTVNQCMYVCLSVCLNVCLSVCLYVCLYVYPSIQGELARSPARVRLREREREVRVRTRTHTHSHTHACTDVCLATGGRDATRHANKELYAQHVGHGEPPPCSHALVQAQGRPGTRIVFVSHWFFFVVVMCGTVRLCACVCVCVCVCVCLYVYV